MDKATRTSDKDMDESINVDILHHKDALPQMAELQYHFNLEIYIVLALHHV